MDFFKRILSGNKKPPQSATSQEPPSRLHDAVLSGDITLLEQCLHDNGNVNASDGDGRTPLHNVGMATVIYNNTAEMCLALISHGADVNVVDKKGATALDKVAFHYVFDRNARDEKRKQYIQVCSILLDNGARPSTTFPEFASVQKNIMEHLKGL